MVEKSKDLQRSHERIKDIVILGPALSATDMDLRAVSQQLCKMPQRQDRATCSMTFDVLFESAASKMKDEHSKEVLANLRKLVAAAEEDLYRPKPRYLDAFFFPNKQNVKKIVQYISMAKKDLLICVFNVTNDDLANAVIERHKAGVNVRVISDDECANNPGSDIARFAKEGISVRTDSEPSYHMHDKFMVCDDKFVLTGSFNWTFQAGSSNQENVLVVDHPYYQEKYTTEFEHLWLTFEKNEIVK